MTHEGRSGFYFMYINISLHRSFYRIENSLNVSKLSSVRKINFQMFSQCIFRIWSRKLKYWPSNLLYSVRKLVWWKWHLMSSYLFFQLSATYSEPCNIQTKKLKCNNEKKKRSRLTGLVLNRSGHPFLPNGRERNQSSLLCLQSQVFSFVFEQFYPLKKTHLYVRVRTVKKNLIFHKIKFRLRTDLALKQSVLFPHHMTGIPWRILP